MDVPYGWVETALTAAQGGKLDRLIADLLNKANQAFQAKVESSEIIENDPAKSAA
jgi:hypothetical protein